MVATALVWIAFASAPGSLHARVDAMRAQVRQNQALEEEDRVLLEAKLADVDSALTTFEQVAGRGEERIQQMKPVMVAGTAILADDATGVGAADDPLLVVAALAAAIVHVRTQAPASDQELQAALGVLDSAIEAAIKAGQIVLSKQPAEKLRGLTGQLAETLARYFGRAIGGKPPDHQEDPKRDRRHWRVEIEAAWKGIQRLLKRKGWSPLQIEKILLKVFASEHLVEIREALNEVARLSGQEPPNFPPPAP